jgi:hypothetical protein|tara:strand:+ start:3766 stop:3957 length:192 start_codon:yes stop_codon:yes gene_type:complete
MSEFSVKKCEECPALSFNNQLSVDLQGFCNILEEAVYFDVINDNCPFLSGEKHSYRKKVSIGG